MAGHVPDVVRDHGSHPERGPLILVHGAFQRRDPDQERGLLQPPVVHGAGAGLRRIEVEAFGEPRGEAGSDQRVAGDGLEELAGQAGVAPGDPAQAVDLDQLRVGARPEEDAAPSARPSRPSRFNRDRAPRVSHSSPRIRSARIQPSGPAAAGDRTPGTKAIGQGPTPGPSEPPSRRPARPGRQVPVHGARSPAPPPT